MILLCIFQLARSSEDYCLGGVPKHKITLDYLKDFFLRYPESPKFAMGFLGELSHADNNPAQYIDQVRRVLRYHVLEKYYTMQ